MVNHRASLVSTWSPPGLPLSGRAWKHTANGWRTSAARGSAMTWPGIGVDTDQAGDLHGDTGLLGGLPDRRIGRALARIDVPAGQLPVAGVTAAHQQHPPGDVADRDESARGHVAGGGGVWLMVIFAADVRPPRPRPAPAAGRGDPARGPSLPGRGTCAWNSETPHPIGGVLIKMVAEPLRVRRARGSHGTPFQQTKGGSRISWHAFPTNERRDARGVWTSYPACCGSGSKPQSSRRPDRSKPGRSLPGPDAAIL